MSGSNKNSGFNFTLSSTPQSNASKINTAATSTPFGFGSAGSLSSTPATNLFGNLKPNSNSSFSLGSSQSIPVSSNNGNIASSASGTDFNGLNFFSNKKESSTSTSTAGESKPSINGQFANSPLATALTTSNPVSGLVSNSSSNNESNKTKIESTNKKTLDSALELNNNISNTGTNIFNNGNNLKSSNPSFLPAVTTENKQKRGTGFELSSSSDQLTNANSSSAKNANNDSKQNINQPVSSSGTLPNVLSFNVPSLSSAGQESKFNSENKAIGLGGTCSSITHTSSAISNPSNKSINSQSKQMAIKDQHLPQALMDCIDEFKKNLEEMRKVKELNSTYTSKTIHQNIQEILTLKQCITQSQTDFQRNLNEVSNLKENIVQELRNVDICDHLKEMPLGFQYDCDIWNEYFMNRVRLFQNKLRILKNQFEQLEGYFKVHDRENIIESQRVVETLKASHKNLLNEAAMLKIAHEKVDQLKNDFLVYRKNVVGDTANIFENNQNNSFQFNLSNSIFKI